MVAPSHRRLIGAILAVTVPIGGLQGCGSQALPGPAKPSGTPAAPTSTPATPSSTAAPSSPAQQVAAGMERVRDPRRVPEGLPTQYPNGPGILIFDPISTGSESIHHFGAGCSRWLFLAVGGRPEVAKTPTWVEVGEQLSIFGGKSDAATISAAMPLARRLGVTHVALGTISGTPGSGTLSYDLWQVAGGSGAPAKVGAPLRRSGTLTKIAATLPSLAEEFCDRLGVPAAQVAESAEAASALQVCGGLWFVPWLTGESQKDWAARQGSHAERDRLRQLGKGSLLARQMGVLADGAAREFHEIAPEVKDLLRRAPGNSQTSAMAAWSLEVTNGLERAHEVGDPIFKLAARFPQCYALCVASSRVSSAKHTDANNDGTFYFDIADHRETERVRLGVEAIRCSTANAVAWERVAAAIRNQARKIRNDREVNSQFRQDHLRNFEQLEQSYPLWLEAAKKVTELDPKWAQGWFRLSQAAAYTGDGALADIACQHALGLPRHPAELFEWALDLYSPQWYADPENLRKAAELVVRLEHTPDERWRLAQKLRSVDQAALSAKVFRTDAERTRWKLWQSAMDQNRPPNSTVRPVIR